MSKPRYDIKLVEKFLRQNFIKPPRSLLARMSGDPEHYSYEIKRVEEHPVSSCCERYSLVWVVVYEHYLEFCRLPSRETWGLFALDEQECLYLNHRYPENIVRLIREEQLARKATAFELSRLASDALLSSKTNIHTPLASADDLCQLTESVSGYVLNKEFFPKFSDEFVSPTLILGSNSIILNYTALTGRTGRQRELIRCTVQIDNNDALRTQSQSLGSNVFLAIPMGRYHAANTK